MWPALAVSGLVVIIFGFFLIFVTGVFGFVVFLAGPIMLIAGLVLKEPNPERPDDPTKRYCKFCMAEVAIKADPCPECQFPSDE